VDEGAQLLDHHRRCAEGFLNDTPLNLEQEGNCRLAATTLMFQGALRGGRR